MNNYYLTNYICKWFLIYNQLIIDLFLFNKFCATVIECCCFLRNSTILWLKVKYDHYCTRQDQALQSWTKDLRQTPVIMRNSALRERFHYYYQEIFTRIDKISILTEGLVYNPMKFFFFLCGHIVNSYITYLLLRTMLRFTCGYIMTTIVCKSFYFLCLY